MLSDMRVKVTILVIKDFIAKVPVMKVDIVSKDVAAAVQKNQENVYKIKHRDINTRIIKISIKVNERKSVTRKEEDIVQKIHTPLRAKK